MRYVIIRDDDTNALTPVDCLERLYAPFLNRGFPVNLATIPEVRTGVTMPDGRPEGFLLGKNGETAEALAIGSNPPLVRYLLKNPGYHILQHGHHHDYLEFERLERHEVRRRLDRGTRLLLDAGFAKPHTFVAPYDRLSRTSLTEVAHRFRVLSTGWFEWRRLPCSWWPGYLCKKISKRPHWRVGRTLLLTHPGCLLSCHRPCDTMLGAIQHHIESHRLTVLVTHWWEYFRNRQADESFIRILHETAAYLEDRSDVRVISFRDLTASQAPLQ